MATITSTPTASSITVSGNTQKTGTISWTKPTVPSGATISSCVLTGTATASMSKGSATITVNGTTVSSGSNFTINLGTANTTTSVTTTAKGGTGNASGTVSFSNLAYTVEYTEAAKVHTLIITSNEDWGVIRDYSTAEEHRGKTITLTAPTSDAEPFDLGIQPDSGYYIAQYTDLEGNTFTNVDTGYLSIEGPGSTPQNFTASITYAKKLTVTFKNWDGSTLKTQTVYSGASATAPSNPSRTGYTFTGWDKTFTNVTSDLTVTAQFTINSYTVTFKDYDGTTLKTQTVNYGSNATPPSNPTREGYTFTGWEGSYTNITSNTTITAQYKVAEQEPETPEGELVEKTEALRPDSVTQDSGYNNTWTDVANTYDTSTSTYGTIIVTGSSQSGFKRKYVDTVFNFDTTHIPADATINSATLTIRAKQSATTNLNITASINGNDVIASTLLSSSTANYTADVKDYVKGLGQLNINLTSAATSNRTFTLYDVRIDVDYSYYAVVPYYTVTFVGWDGTVLKTQSVPEGSNATAPSAPARIGHTFSGWDKAYTNITSDLTVTAQYTIDKHKVTFKDWDGTVLKTEDVEYGSSANPPTPTREGYTFVGWDKEYTNITYDVTITAQYKNDNTESKLNIGGTLIDTLYIGGQPIEKIYIGNTLIFGAGSGSGGSTL